MRQVEVVRESYRVAMPAWTHRQRPVHRVLAIIPARGGSKGVPGKNLRPVGGVPLITRAVATARASSAIDAVVVSTDDKQIADVAADAGAEIMARPARLSTDTASSELALLNTLERLGHVPEVIVFMQATSPFIRTADLDIAVHRVIEGGCDVAFSAVRTHAFLWEAAAAGVVGVNHDLQHRHRRQDRAPQYQETGAFYVMRTTGFLESHHRFFGTVAVALTDPRFAIEIDDEADLEVADALAPLFDVPSDTAEDGDHPTDRKETPWLSPSVPIG